MRVISLRGAQLGDFGPLADCELPSGVVAVLGFNGRSRRALHDLLGSFAHSPAEVATAPVRLDEMRLDAALERIPDHLAHRLWTGLGFESSEALIEGAARALAWAEGLDRVELALRRLDTRIEDGASVDRADPDASRRLELLRGAPAELAEADDRLRSLLATETELVGELEVATATWLRERQDAETHLQAYRDRARELKQRLHEVRAGGADASCPTCRRPLSDHADVVLEFLAEEWEDVVQDGSWWRRRRQQLDGKPEALVDLERRGRELHAEVARCAARVEAARGRVRDFEQLAATLDRVVPSDAGQPDDLSDHAAALSAARALRQVARELLEHARDRLRDRAASHLVRLTDGRLLGTEVLPSGRVGLIGPEGPLGSSSDDDVAALELALRLAAVELLWTSAQAPSAGFIVGHAFDRLDSAMKLRAASLFSELTRAGLAQVIVVTRGDVVDLVPEAFDGVLELESAPSGGMQLRGVPAGIGSIALRQLPSSLQRSPSA